MHDDIVDEPVDAAKAALVAWCALERKDIVRCPDQPCRAGQPPEEDVVVPPVDRRLEVDDVWSRTPDLGRRSRAPKEARATRDPRRSGGWRLRASPTGRRGASAGRRDLARSARAPVSRGPRRLPPPLVTRARATECRPQCRHGGTDPRAARASSGPHVVLVRTQVARATRSDRDRPTAIRTTTYVRVIPAAAVSTSVISPVPESRRANPTPSVAKPGQRERSRKLRRESD